MQTDKWSFRPGLAASLATLLILPVLVWLGLWQLHRADEKQALFDAYQARTVAAAQNLDVQADIPLEQLQWRKATVHGNYQNSPTLLLDNQVYNGEAGYHVFNLLDTGQGGKWIMVNRGWIAAGPYRDQPPQIPASIAKVELNGVATAFPSVPGISMVEKAEPELMQPGLYRVQRINQAMIENLLGRQIQEYVLRLEPQSESGFTRVWPEPGSGRERHLGYAFQWFSMAVALVVIYVSLNLKRRIGNAP